MPKKPQTGKTGYPDVPVKDMMKEFMNSAKIPKMREMKFPEAQDHFDGMGVTRPRQNIGPKDHNHDPSEPKGDGDMESKGMEQLNQIRPNGPLAPYKTKEQFPKEKFPAKEGPHQLIEPAILKGGS